MSTNLYERFGRKKYLFTSEFSEILNQYIQQENKKSFIRQMRRLCRNDITEREDIIVELSSLITHYLLACKNRLINPNDLETMTRGLLAYSAGDDDYLKEILSQVSKLVLKEG